MIWEEVDCTYDEFVLTTLAHQLRDGDRVFTGVASPVQMMATLLAKTTHAPQLLYFTLLGSINPKPQKVPFSTGDPHLFDEIENAITFPEIFDLANTGRMDVAFLGGVQIDEYGSLNMIVIGDDYLHPKVRLPGGAGGPLMIRSFHRIISWRPNHSRRCFVQKLPFTTSPGWITEAKGSRHGGPNAIVTDLCVFQFHQNTRQITLASLHPGIDVDTVKARTGFVFDIPTRITMTPLPTPHECKIIRSVIDPKGIRKAFLSTPHL